MNSIIIIFLCIVCIGLVAMLYSSYQECENTGILMRNYRDLYHETQKELMDYKKGVSKMIIEENQRKKENG